VIWAFVPKDIKYLVHIMTPKVRAKNPNFSRHFWVNKSLSMMWVCSCHQIVHKILLLRTNNGTCHVSGNFLPFKGKSHSLSSQAAPFFSFTKGIFPLLQRNPAHMTRAIIIGINLRPSKNQLFGLVCKRNTVHMTWANVCSGQRIKISG
jgi:hypothetical protein